MPTHKKVWALLSPHERRRGLQVLGLVIVMAVMETIGVASVMPFLTVLGDPNALETAPYLQSLYDRFGFQSLESFLLALGVASFVMLLVSSIFRVATTFVLNHYTQMRRHSIGQRLLAVYLRQPYAFFLNRNSGDLVKSILSEVDQLIGTVFKPLLDVIAYSLVAAAIIVLLLLNDPWLALGLGVTIGGSYLLIFSLIQKRAKTMGRERLEANKERFIAAGEALAGIKDIKLLGRERAYLTRFRPASERFSRHQATNTTISEIPRYFIEMVGFGAVIALALVLVTRTEGVSEVLPMLGLYAFAGYKLLPAAQRVYASMTRLRFGSAAVDHVYTDLVERATGTETLRPSRAKLAVTTSIRLHHVSFSYPGSARPALRDIDLTIPKGGSLGLVGTTGAGKTTLVDLVLGLLRPTAGELQVDGKPVTDQNLREWQNTLGYVPQNIFLVDASVAENIALGIPKEEIDYAAVEACARMTQIHHFIVDQLSAGYDTEVGERGVRLSGGQRQRIGIARALYHDPEVLVFDEATSALDNITEKAVIDAVNALSHQKTVIMIAHRLSTVEKCERIVLLEHGEVKGSGSYAELLHGNATFQAMVANS